MVVKCHHMDASQEGSNQPMGNELKEAIFGLIQNAEGGQLRWQDIESEIEAAIAELKEENRIAFEGGQYVVKRQ